MKILQHLKTVAPKLSRTNHNPDHPPEPPPPPGDFTVLNDHFIGWLRFANAGMLDAGNIVAMDYAIKHMPSGALLEIGSFCGLSTNVLTHLRRRHHRHDPFFTSDPWLFEGADSPHVPMGDGGITFGEYRQLIKDSFHRNTTAFSRHDLPHTIETTSDQFFNLWSNKALTTDVYNRPAQLGGPIAFAYIDGDHSHDQSKRDFENVHRHLLPGGFILFDDSADGTPWEVCTLVKEIQHTNPNYHLIGKYGNYLFQKLN